MTDDTQLLQDAAERAKAVLPEPIAEVIGAHLGQHTTSHSVLDKPALARAVLALPAPAVDREGLIAELASHYERGLSTDGHDPVTIGCECGWRGTGPNLPGTDEYRAHLADALITAGQVGGKRAVSEPGIRAADTEYPGDPEYLGGFIWGHLGGANVTPRQARSLADALIADGLVGGTDAQQRVDAALAVLADRHEDWCPGKLHADCCGKDCECGYGEIRRALTAQETPHA